MKKIFILLILIGLNPGMVLKSPAFATETNFMDMAYVDKRPWKLAWIHDHKLGWHVVACFEKVNVTYFFKEGPTKDKGLNLSSSNSPYKIIVQPQFDTSSFVINDISYEQWEDGAKSFSGTLEKEVKINGEKFSAINVALVEEVPTEENYSNYSFWK